MNQLPITNGVVDLAGRVVRFEAGAERALTGTDVRLLQCLAERAWVARFDPNGALLWATACTGPAYGLATDLAALADGALLVTGLFRADTNTARLLENNPVLLRLKELEALGDLAARIERITIVVGGPRRLVGNDHVRIIAGHA